MNDSMCVSTSIVSTVRVSVQYIRTRACPHHYCTTCTCILHSREYIHACARTYVCRASPSRLTLLLTAFSTLHHCRHTLAKPKTWKLGATETLSLTIYDWNQRSRFIDATLYVRRCTCVHRPRFQRRCMDDEIFSSTQVQARPGKPTFRV